MSIRKFTIAASEISGILVLDIANAKANESESTSHLAESLFLVMEELKYRKVLVDMKGIPKMTSEVIGQLVMLIKKCKIHDYQMKLCGVVAESRLALDLVRLDQLVEMHEQKSQGIVAFKVGMHENKIADPTLGSASDYLESAQAGDSDAQFRLAKCFDAGSGVEQDFEKALEWFEKAAAQEHADAGYALGIAHAYGIGTRQNFTTAFDWFRSAADLGHAEAQFWVGLSMHHGLVEDADVKSALRWYEAAAEQGNNDAREQITQLRRVV